MRDDELAYPVVRQGFERGFQAHHPSVVGSYGGLEAFEDVTLGLALDALLDLQHLVEHLARRGGKGQHGMTPDPLPEIVVELSLELSVRLGRPCQHEMLESSPAPQREQPLGDVPEMARPMVVHVALHPHLRSAALIVPTGDVVGDAGHLLDLAHLHDE